MTVYTDFTNKFKGKLHLSVIYRLLSKKMISYNEIKTIIKSKEVIIVRDFNLPNINWNMLIADCVGTRLMEVIEYAFLEQLIKKPRGKNSLILSLPVTQT